MSVALIAMLAVVAVPLLLLVVDLFRPRQDAGRRPALLRDGVAGGAGQTIRPGDGMVYRPGDARQAPATSERVAP